MTNYTNWRPVAEVRVTHKPTGLSARQALSRWSSRLRNMHLCHRAALVLLKSRILQWACEPVCRRYSAVVPPGWPSRLVRTYTMHPYFMIRDETRPGRPIMVEGAKDVLAYLDGGIPLDLKRKDRDE